MKKETPFYIGWQDQAPPEIRGIIRNAILGIGLLVIVYAGLLVLSQQGFDKSVFELGNLSERQGILVTYPVPMLKVPMPKPRNNVLEYQSIMLIGFGKFGAEATLAAMEKKAGFELAGKQVRLRGTRIYYQGKQAFELTEGAAALLVWEDPKVPYQAQEKDFGRVSLVGEILDPKCALGVMKPGFGKPHRSCAVRCIAGGIPPVLRMQSQIGGVNYCLVRGPSGEAINKEVLAAVADPVLLCGQLRQIDDWLVMYLDPVSDLKILPSQGNWEAMVMCNR